MPYKNYIFNNEDIETALYNLNRHPSLPVDTVMQLVDLTSVYGDRKQAFVEARNAIISSYEDENNPGVIEIDNPRYNEAINKINELLNKDVAFDFDGLEINLTYHKGEKSKLTPNDILALRLLGIKVKFHEG